MVVRKDCPIVYDTFCEVAKVLMVSFVLLGALFGWQSARQAQATQAQLTKPAQITAVRQLPNDTNVARLWHYLTQAGKGVKM